MATPMVASDRISGLEVVEGDAAQAVLAGQHAEREEDEEQRGADARRDDAGEDADQDQAGADEDEGVTEIHSAGKPSTGLRTERAGRARGASTYL
jgi:hypothetical protein